MIQTSVKHTLLQDDDELVSQVNRKELSCYSRIFIIGLQEEERQARRCVCAGETTHVCVFIPGLWSVPDKLHPASP